MNTAVNLLTEIYRSRKLRENRGSRIFTGDMVTRRVRTMDGRVPKSTAVDVVSQRVLRLAGTFRLMAAASAPVAKNIATSGRDKGLNTEALGCGIACWNLLLSSLKSLPTIHRERILSATRNRRILVGSHFAL